MSSQHSQQHGFDPKSIAAHFHEHGIDPDYIAAQFSGPMREKPPRRVRFNLAPSFFNEMVQTSEHSGENAEAGRSHKPPDRPPPLAPSQHLSRVGISVHATRKLKDDTIVRGKQGATFGGFIPPKRAPPRPPLVTSDSDSSEHDSSRDAEYELDDEYNKDGKLADRDLGDNNIVPVRPFSENSRNAD